MLKIIDVPEDYIVTLSYRKSADDIYEIEYNQKDLPDYTPKPLTADGLTLREFAYKAKGDMSNVQRFGRESMEWKDCNDHLPRVVLDMVSLPEIMEIYRIKPEVVHYIGHNIFITKCGEKLGIKENYTHVSSEVTCPDCIEAMKPKYVPWNFDTAPNYFVDQNEHVWSKTYDHNRNEWGMISIGRKIIVSNSFTEMLNLGFLIDGSPCGVKI